MKHNIKATYKKRFHKEINSYQQLHIPDDLNGLQIPCAKTDCHAQQE